MSKLNDVTNYLIHLATSEAGSEALCTRKLQKLLYYAQGLHLAKHGTPLFPEKIKAWTEGPVVPQVWHDYKEFNWKIPTETTKGNSLALEERVFIRQIWQLLRSYSGTALSEKTHKEEPWVIARKGIPADAKSDAEITKDSMQSFFQKENIVLPDVVKPVGIRNGRDVFDAKDARKLFPVDI